MAHCEWPMCKVMHDPELELVRTPYGDPVLCPVHNARLAIALTGLRLGGMQARLELLWIPPAFKFGPVVRAERVLWLEGRAPLIEPVV